MSFNFNNFQKIKLDKQDFKTAKFLYLLNLTQIII